MSNEGKRSFRDWAGLANLLLSALAIVVALYVFHKQSQSDDATSKVLTDSRDALVTATHQLNAEQTELKKMTVNLEDANAALDHMLSVTREQYEVAGDTLGVSRNELNILNATRSLEVANLRAEPDIQFGLDYVSGDTVENEPRAYIMNRRAFAPGTGAEQTLTFDVLLTNRGSAIAPKPIVQIGTPLTLVNPRMWDCVALLAHQIQCNSTFDLLIGETERMRFLLAAPGTTGTYEITVHADTNSPTGRYMEFTQSFLVFLKAPTR